MKKDQYKFTIRFNSDDPRQREAADILNQQRVRNKAVFLTNAILGETPLVSEERESVSTGSFELDQETAQSISKALDMFG